MKMHLKPILWLVGGIAVMFMVSLAIDLYRNAAMLRKFSDDNLAQMQQREQQNAENIFATAENSVKNSLERGEMDKFVFLLQGQKVIKGLQEFSLYDQNGVATHSSDHAFENRRLPADLQGCLRTNFQQMTRCANGSFEIYHSQKVHADCLRCHVGWKEGESAGVLLGRFSTESLKQSRDQWVRSAAAMKRSQITGGLLTTLFIVVVFGALAAFVMHGQLIVPLMRALDKLTAVFSQVRATSNQLSANSQTLAEGASEQAASIEETSASLEELASMTRRNAENVQKTNDLAKQARSAADQGAGDMRAMSSAMEAIKASSDDIAKIIKTIDEIAFQTNILALNAAVEAARAGEAGMGFAVVADEVRNLAQRSAQAAKETAGKIEGAISKTTQGVAITQKVGAALNEIVAKARQVDELATEVAGASREQTQGITQINAAVSQMDKVTQNNAANAEESAAAAAELNAHAETMKESVAELFQLVGGSGEAAATRPAVPALRKKEVHATAPAAKRSAPVHGNGHAHAEPATSGKANGRSQIPLEGGFKDF